MGTESVTADTITDEQINLLLEEDVIGPNTAHFARHALDDLTKSFYRAITPIILRRLEAK